MKPCKSKVKLYYYYKQIDSLTHTSNRDTEFSLTPLRAFWPFIEHFQCKLGTCPEWQFGKQHPALEYSFNAIFTPAFSLIFIANIR